MPPFSSNCVTCAAAPVPGAWPSGFIIICNSDGLLYPEPALSIQILVKGACTLFTGVPPTKRSLSPTL